MREFKRVLGPKKEKWGQRVWASTVGGAEGGGKKCGARRAGSRKNRAFSDSRRPFGPPGLAQNDPEEAQTRQRARIVLFWLGMALNRGHNSTKILPQREESTKFATGEGKKCEISGGPAEAGPAKKMKKLPLLQKIKNEEKIKH